MILTLERFSYAPTETEGRLLVGDFTFFTMEKPWVPWTTLGGKPFSSCIPDGEYIVKPFAWHNGDRVYSLENAANHVYVTKTELDGIGGGGRYACLIHPANWVHQVVGCIAPGEERGILDGKRAVLHSSEAMRVIRELLSTDTHHLVIEPRAGASGTL